MVNIKEVVGFGSGESSIHEFLVDSAGRDHIEVAEFHSLGLAVSSDVNVSVFTVDSVKGGVEVDLDSILLAERTDELFSLGLELAESVVGVNHMVSGTLGEDTQLLVAVPDGGGGEEVVGSDFSAEGEGRDVEVSISL